MTGTTTRDFVWPGRLPSTESLKLYEALKRVAGVHGALSRCSNGCEHPIAWQGCRAGAGRGGRSMPFAKVLALFLFWGLFYVQISAAQSDLNAESPDANQKAPEAVEAGKFVPLTLEPQPPCQFNPEQGPELVILPGGQFLMGSPNTEAARSDDEGPQHWVSVQPFAMGRCEVTVAEFKLFITQTGYKTEAEQIEEGKDQPKGCYSWNGKTWETNSESNWRNPGFEQKDQQPVVCVSWNDIQYYISWLNLRTGTTYRLPTEAEWEFAARAGTSTRFYYGDDPNYSEICVYANGYDESGKSVLNRAGNAPCLDQFTYTAPVASFKTNAFGLHDMSGNVWEWTADCWHKNYVNAPPDGSAWELESSGDCSYRVVRGGSWNSYPRSLRSAYRNGDVVVRNYSQGFRLARTLEK